MNYCHVCETDCQTYGEMEPGRGVVLKCCTCKVAVRETAHAVVAPSAIAAVATVERSVPRAELQTGAPLTASALLAAAATRRAAVGAALAEMASLQAEALILDRILAAAEPLN